MSGYGEGVASININFNINTKFPTKVFGFDKFYGKQKKMSFPDMSNQLQTDTEFLVNNTRTPDGVKIPQNYVLPAEERQGLYKNLAVKNPLLKGFPNPKTREQETQTFIEQLPHHLDIVRGRRPE